MTGKARGGLGRGLAALIPTGPAPTTWPTCDQRRGPRGREHAPGRPRHAQPGGAERATDPVGAGRREPPRRRPRPDRGTGTPRLVDGRRRPSYDEVPIDDDRAQPAAARQVFDEEALAELDALDPRVRAAAADRRPRACAGGGYELIMGERRWRAAQRAGLARIPAIVRGTDGRRPAARRAAGEHPPGSSSTRWRRRPPTSSCWRSSASPTRSWPPGSVAAAR